MNAQHAHPFARAIYVILCTLAIVIASAPILVVLEVGLGKVVIAVGYLTSDGLMATAAVAVTSSIAVTFGGAVTAASLRWGSRRPSAVVIVGLFAPALVPPLLLAFGYAIVANLLGVAQGPALVIVAEFTAFLPIAVAILLRRMAALPVNLFSSAWNLGAPFSMIMLDVIFPAITRELIGTWCLIFVLCVSDSVFELMLAGSAPLLGQTLNNLSLSASVEVGFGLGAIYIVFTIVVLAVAYGALGRLSPSPKVVIELGKGG